MPAYLTMPKLSDTMSEGTLVKWLKSEGDSVGIDEEIAEVETDKATMAMPSFDEGVIHKIYVKEGDTVPLGATLALILEEGEEPPEDADPPPASPAGESSTETKEEKEEQASDAPAEEEKSETAPAASSGSASSPAPTNASSAHSVTPSDPNRTQASCCNGPPPTGSCR